jgi:hypothetical protein
MDLHSPHNSMDLDEDAIPDSGSGSGSEVTPSSLTQLHYRQ